MKKTINVSLDIKRVTAQPSAIPPLVAGDTGNSFVITLTDAGSPVDLSGHKVVAVFSKVSDGTTVEQDTEDAVVSLSAIGINLIGTPSSEDTITVTETAQQVTAETTVSLATVTVDADLFRAAYPNVDEYVFEYNGTAWQYGENSVKISGTSHNIITIDPVKSGSYGNGKNNCELQIFNGSQLITSAQFSFDGRAAISNDRTIQAQEKFPVLVQMIKRIEGIEHGTGFMLTETYDPNGDGKVISAESADTATNAAKLGTHDPSYYATAESVSSITPESIGAAVPATSVTVSIGTDGWSTSGEGYEKTVSVSGVTSTANVIVTPAPESFTAWTDAVIRAKTIGSGTITFYTESVPESSVTANVMVAQSGSGTIGGTGGVVVSGVQDVKVNGTSVVTNGVANIPIETIGDFETICDVTMEEDAVFSVDNVDLVEAYVMVIVPTDETRSINMYAYNGNTIIGSAYVGSLGGSTNKWYAHWFILNKLWISTNTAKASGNYAQIYENMPFTDNYRRSVNDYPVIKKIKTGSAVPVGTQIVCYGRR